MNPSDDLQQQIAQYQPRLRPFVASLLKQTPLTDYGADGVDDVTQSVDEIREKVRSKGKTADHGIAEDHRPQ